MEYSTFRRLLKKYLSENISPAEKQELSRLLEQPEYNRLLEEMLQEELDREVHVAAPDNGRLLAIKEHLQQRLQQKPGTTRTYYIKWISIAAMLLLLACTGVYYGWYYHKPAPVETAKVQPAKGLIPGGNKAVLTLADGSAIVLDTTKDGRLTTQGAVKVIKLADGQLAYQQAADTGAIVYNSIATPRGGQYQLTLSDGTQVWLNASSVLRFPVAFNGKERRVMLTGEGYFEVAKNAAKPFHVEVNAVDVEVKGTHFNINAYENEGAIRTTLLEGSVRVAGHAGECLLKPGQQAVAKGVHSLHVKNSVDIDAVVAWKNGKFTFKGADLGTILRQASRWYDIDFVYNDTVDEKFSGDISRTVNAEQLLSILELTGKVGFQIKGKSVTVIPK
ncbi:ferric-dicitrate binding protein FerR (iron transport regulator) [Filimonas zeae]|uniref:Iron dicitrate transporter FecR n=1 Tax=Filimonas zeae TaxID=1737353 RepID=A0A917IQ93_9BACT|nr:FecR family protein [Filimonas zeae]MDR6337988.1 ferric-dicitrate binding protein FerR (iron transport regulator) [Filimonas zeae]GGH61176.1 iron dicitrate transporter FecR [Filimonas zeae]